jgi:hypothetical protein
MKEDERKVVNIMGIKGNASMIKVTQKEGSKN